MKLDDVSAELRPRSPWEAIDLGLGLSRRHFRVLLGVTALASLPPLILSITLSLAGWPLAWLPVWWTKPLWERPALFVLSQALFGAEPTVRDTLRAFPSYGLRDALRWLTLYRLSPTRSLDLPVTQLEALQGGARRARLLSLRRGGVSNAAVWLTTLGFHIEAFLLFAAVAFAALLVPEEVDFNAFQWFLGLQGDAAAATLEVLTTLLSWASAVLVAVFYVGAGFSLYVHQRTALEGWDLEVAFRRIAGRLRNRARRATRAALGVCGLLAAGFPFADGARAETHAGSARAASLDAATAQARIEEILSGPDFHEIEEFQVPAFVNDWALSEEEQTPEWLQQLLDTIAGFASWVAGSIETLLIASAALILLWLAYQAWNAGGRMPWSRGSPGERRGGSSATRVVGLDIREESLPASVSQTASAQYRRGEVREALALLYRASLARMASDYALSLHEGATEGDCLAGASMVLPEASASYFDALTSAWQRCAYAQQNIGRAQFELLCDAWDTHFAGRAAPEELGR